jgi:sporulation protein YlmC with PRC-barrel domain
MTEVKSKLLSLKDAGLTTESPAEDIRGRDVVDAAGEKIGHVNDLLIDDRERKVRLMEIGHGGILGIGESKVLVPIDAISRVEDDVVHISQTREHVAGAPRYDPEIVEETDYYGSLYGYYGVGPYWGAGYAYPAFPYYL